MKSLVKITTFNVLSSTTQLRLRHINYQHHRLYSQVTHPTTFRSLEVIDTHTAGGPSRIVTNLSDIPGRTMYQQRVFVMKNMDHIRKILLHEPRGYPCQNAVIITQSLSSKAAFGAIFMEQNGIYPLMSGHNLICACTAMIESGSRVVGSPKDTFYVDTPGGLIEVIVEGERGRPDKITFTNVPSFVAHLDAEVNVPEIGKVRVDIAFGGMWYAIVNAAEIGLELKPQNGKKIGRLGEMIKAATREQYPVNHPDFDYPGCDILAFRGPPSPGSRAHAANAVVMSKVPFDWNNPDTWFGMIDRSPCGTGTSAIMAVLFKRGELKLGQTFVHESILGTTFTGKLIEETAVGEYRAVIPTISGNGYITQHSTIKLHPSDPFKEGYIVGDIW